MKTIMVTETMGKQERFEESKHPDSQICDVIDINGTVIVEGEDSGESGWEKRHGEIEKQREAIRQRVRNTKIGNAVIRPAKPKPTISDTGGKAGSRIRQSQYEEHRPDFFHRKPNTLLSEKSAGYTQLEPS